MENSYLKQVSQEDIDKAFNSAMNEDEPPTTATAEPMKVDPNVLKKSMEALKGIKRGESPVLDEQRSSGGRGDSKAEPLNTNLINKIKSIAKKYKHKGPLEIKLGVKMPCSETVALANSVQIQLMDAQQGNTQKMILILLDPAYILEVHQRAMDELSKYKEEFPGPRLIKPNGGSL